MKELYKRFNITIDIDKSIEIFQNKIENILGYGLLGEKIFDDKKDDIYWELCNELGLEYSYASSNGIKTMRILSHRNFPEYLLRLQALLDLLYSYNKKQCTIDLIDIIEKAINASPVDLGIKLKIYKRKGAQINFSGSRFLDQKLVDDVLGVLEDKEKSAVKLAFEKGLKEFLEAKSSPSKLKNAVRDMQLSCDETIKVLFKNKNLGFRHLFKDNRWEKAGLNDYQKQIFWNLNEYADKFAKHKSDSKITPEDAENIIYLTGMFIRLVFIKSENVKF